MVEVDTSVFVSYFSPNEIYHTISREWLREQVSLGTTIVVPVLAFAELGASLARRTNDSAVAYQSINQIQSLPNLQIVGIDQTVGLHAMNLAITLRLRGADAVFAAVAFQLNIPLVTWDKELLTRTAGVVTAIQPSV